MPLRMRALRSAARVSLAVAVVLLTLLAGPITGRPAFAQNATPAPPNSYPAYRALRNLALSGDAVTVNNLELKRDAGTFHLRSGVVCFVTPVESKVTGAVFIGDGNFILDPPESERSMLKLLTKEDEFSENFSQMTLRFTDSTYEEIKKGGTAGAIRLRCRSPERQPAHDPPQTQDESRFSNSRRRSQSRARRTLHRLHPRQALQRPGAIHHRSS